MLVYDSGSDLECSVHDDVKVKQKCIEYSYKTHRV